jgi:hypothetical protein
MDRHRCCACAAVSGDADDPVPKSNSSLRQSDPPRWTQSGRPGAIFAHFMHNRDYPSLSAACSSVGDGAYETTPAKKRIDIGVGGLGIETLPGSTGQSITGVTPLCWVLHFGHADNQPAPRHHRN